MRLKNLGLVSSAIKSIGKGATDIEKVSNAVKNLSFENTAAVLTTTNLTDVQKLQIMMDKGLTEEKAKELLANASLSASNAAAAASTGVLSGAMAGLKAAIHGVTAAIAANPIGFAIMAIVTAITAVVQIANKVKQSEEEARQAAIESADAASTLSSEISELTNKYLELSNAVKTDESAKESLLSTQNELIKKLGIEQSKVDELTAKYGSLSEAIKRASVEKLQESERDIRGGLNEQEKALLKKGKADWGIDSIILSGSKTNGFFSTSDKTRKEQIEAYKALKALEDAGLISSGSYSSYTDDNGTKYSQGFSTVLGIDDDLTTVEGVINVYEKLGKMLDAVSNSAGSNNFVYETLYKKYNSLTPVVNDYNTAIGSLNSNLAQQYMLNGLMGRELPATQAEFEAYKQSVIDSAIASGQFVGSQTDIENAINSVLKEQSQFAKFYATVSEGGKEIDRVAESLKQFKTTVNSLKSATDEYNASGSVSVDTYNELISANKDYADLFDFSSGKIEIATDKVNNLVDELIAEYGATLAANGATESQISQMVSLAKSLTSVKEEADDVVGTIQDLADILQDAADGTEMSVFETWELITNYPELASAITKTTNGYILEENAVRELIKAKAELLGMEASEARKTARENFVNHAKNEESANNVDRIFADYYNRTGTNIKSFDEYVSAWESYFGKTANGNWVDGLEEYVAAIISDNSVNNVMSSLIEDMKNPDTLLTSTSEKAEENPISKAFDELESVYSGRLQELEYLEKTYNNAIQSLENQGYDVPASYYEKLKEVEEEKIKLLGEELESLTAKFQEAINAGEIQEGTSEFYDMNNAINSVKESIQDSNLALQEYSNTIRDLEWKKFDDIQDKISKITEESEFLLELLDDKDMVDKSGNLTEHGNAAMGLHGVNYNVYMEQAKRYAEELAEIESDIANDPANQTLIDRREELLELQRDSILAAEEEKQAMVDLVKDGIDAQLDALDELIDKYKDALDGAKDLYDYQNKVSDITDEIGSLQKQIIAYENDTSEEAKAQIQQLKVDLQKANEELQETEYDQFIADQKKLLDNLYTEYETILNSRIDDVDTLIVDSINAINTNATDIKTTLETTASGLGVALSNDMSSIWTVDDEIKQVVSNYSANFDANAGAVNSSLGAINGVTTTISSTLSGIDTDIGATNTTLSNINSAIGGLAGQLASKIAPLINTNNAGDASNPGGSTGDGKPSGSAIQDNAPLTIYTDPKPEANTSSTSKSNIRSAGALRGDVTLDMNKEGASIVTGDSGTKYIKTSIGRYYKLSDCVALPYTGTEPFAYWLKAGTQWYAKAYKNGGLADYTGLAWLDGTKTKPEMVLDAEDTQNFVALRDVLSSMMESDISYGNPLYSSFEPMSYKTGVPELASKMAQIMNSYGETKVENHFDITIPIDKVEDYNDFVTQLRDDPKFEKMVQAMTIGRINGGNRNAKYNYSWKDK